MNDDPRADAAGRAVVLLVDDEAMILSALKSSLRHEPWRLLSTTSPEEALRLMAEEPVAVVVADYLMPGMDGVELLARVKQGWPEVGRIMLTGVMDPQMFERAVNRAEVSRFLFKPWSEAQLRTTIAECLERSALRADHRRMAAEHEALARRLEELNHELEERVTARTEALIQAQKMAALGRLAGGVAHEINNPLGGMLAFLQVLERESGLPASAREPLEAIHACALRCKHVVDSLLAFAQRVPAGARVPLRLGGLVEQALLLVRMHPMARQVSIEWRPPEGAEPAVLGQPILLQQVVVNLLFNALQASRPGQRIELRLGAEPGWVRLEVEDQGVGIPPELMPELFEPFSDARPLKDGASLGLALCFGLVQEHGGTLAAHSQAGRGTVFRVRLPAVDEDAGQAAGQERT
jgi:signal transduction histidine kinase